MASVAALTIVLHNQYDRSDVDGMIKARTSLERPTMYVWSNHFYGGKLAWENKMRECSSCYLGNNQYWHRNSAIWIWFDGNWMEYGAAYWDPVEEVSGGDRYKPGWLWNEENTLDEDPGDDWTYVNSFLDDNTVTRWAFLIHYASSAKHRVDGDHVVRSKISGTWPKWTGSKADLNLQTAGGNLNRTYPWRLTYEWSESVWDSVNHTWKKLDWKTRSTRENGEDRRFSATDDGSWTDDIIGDNAVVRGEYVKGWSDLYWTVVRRPESRTQWGEVMDDDGEGTGEFHDYTVHYKTPIPQLTHDYETYLD